MNLISVKSSIILWYSEKSTPHDFLPLESKLPLPARIFPVLGLLLHHYDTLSPTINLVPLQPKELQHLGPETDRWGQEACLVRIDDRSFPNQIRLTGPDPSRLLDELPADEEHRRHNHHGVVAPKCGYTPWRKAGISIREHYQNHAAQTDVGTIWLKVAVVRECSSVDALSFAGLVKGDVRCAHDDVVDDTTGGNQVDKPGEDLRGAGGD